MIDKFVYIKFLENEIEVLNSRIQKYDILNSRIQKYDTGHLITTISVLKNRIEEIEKEVNLSLV